MPKSNRPTLETLTREKLVGNRIDKIHSKTASSLQGRRRAQTNSKPKEVALSNKYQVIIAENAEVLLDCMEGDTSAGESFFADSLEKAERILFERTTIPGKGGVIIPPDSDEPSLTVFPMRTKE